MAINNFSARCLVVAIGIILIYATFARIITEQTIKDIALIIVGAVFGRSSSPQKEVKP